MKAEGIFRITAENSQEAFVRDQLNKGIVPHGIDVHCLSGLIKVFTNSYKIHLTELMLNISKAFRLFA
jgi:hypothetical protein